MSMTDARLTQVPAPALRARGLLSWATPIALALTGLCGFVLVLITRTNADADLWGHLRFGLDMLTAGSLHTTDPYSFTSDRPWINHEWAAEVTTAAAWLALGGAGLVLLKLLVIGGVAGLASHVARQERARPVARLLFVLLVVFGTYTRTQVVRPQLFSVLIFGLLLYLLREFDRGRTRALWAVPFCFAAWANFHGGWLVGLACLGVWMAMDAWQHRSMRRAATLAAAGAASVLATLGTPYGFGLWRFLAETVRLSREGITDWQPIHTFAPALLAFEALIPIVGVLALWVNRTALRARTRELAVVAVLAYATFRIGRTDAFLMLAIALLFAGPIVEFLNRADDRVRGHLARPSLAVAFLIVVLAGRIGVDVVGNFRGVRVAGYWIPDRAATAALREARPGARVLTWFDWGEYAIWQLAPAGIRVSMDGRRETVYSAQVIDDHFRFYNGDPAMLDYPDRIGADLVWLPSRAPMIDLLSRAGWQKALDTGTSVVLQRSGPPIPLPAASDADARIFPWP